MSGYIVESMERRGEALVARVRFTAPDGRTKDARYSWPVATTKREIESSLEKFYGDFLAQPASPPPIHEAMELVGQPEDLSHLDPGATS